MIIVVTFTSFATKLLSAWPIVIFLLVGGMSIRPPKIDSGVVILLSALTGAAAIPVVFAGVAELRLVEFSGVIMFAISSLMLFVIGAIWRPDSRAEVRLAP